MAELSATEARNPQVFHRDTLFDSGSANDAEATVCITLYQYETHIVDALESAFEHDFRALGLVILDDCSSDNGPKRAERWLEKHSLRFAFTELARHRQNRGLAAARNGAFDLSPSEFVMTLDADNQLYPRCVSRLYASLAASDFGFAYSIIGQFEDRVALMGCNSWSPELLKFGNYIDAMSLIRKSVWARLGGYSRMQVGGWEDFDFWCKLVAAGINGLFVPEILARYRVHSSSMLSTETTAGLNEQQVKRQMQARHPWLEL